MTDGAAKRRDLGKSPRREKNLQDINTDYTAGFGSGADKSESYPR